MKYNWKITTPMYKFLDEIYINTPLKMDRRYRHLANEFSQNTEEFVKQCMDNGFITYQNLRRCLENLKSVSFIDVLPENQRGIYGITTNDSVQVNPNLDSNRRRLYQFHELAHKLIRVQSPVAEVIKYNRGRKERGKSALNANNLLDGWALLEEAIVQNIAEGCFYTSINQPRPQQRYQQEPRVIGDKKFKTNFDFYGIYQPLTTRFARTIRGIGTGKNDSDDLILNEFSKKACNGDFIKAVTEEYSRDVGIDRLMELIEKLGKIFNEKSATFGNGTKMTTVQETQMIWNSVIAEMIKLEDYRPAIVGNANPNFGGDNR